MISDTEFKRLVRVDTTIRALKQQIPTILTKPLTPTLVEEVYSKSFRFDVSVDEIINTGVETDELQDGVLYGENYPKKEDNIVILRSRDELVSLSDVLVLATAVAQQAALVTGTSDNNVNIECQLIIDAKCEVIRILWRAKAPALGSLSATSNSNLFNNLEGVTDCFLTSNEDVDDGEGKIKRFVVRKANFNGRLLNGPAIGQALKSIQSTVANLQQNPFVRNIVQTIQPDEDNRRGMNIFTTLRDEVLGQAATAVSERLSSDPPSNSGSERFTTKASSNVSVYQVESIDEIPIATEFFWMNGVSSTSKIQGQSKLSGTPLPCPGTNEWDEFVDSRSCLLRFSSNVIPQLSDLSIVDPNLFSEDAIYKLAAEDSIVMTGRESLANFFQSMALTREGTGGTWTLNRCTVLDWKKRRVAISYEATSSSLPLWRIKGRDVYQLDSTTSGDERPIIVQIYQGKMFALGPNGNEVKLDGRWLVENVASAFQGDGSNKPRDFLTELLMNQPSLSPLLRQPKATKQALPESRRKLSESAAAASYYAMTDLYEQGISLFETSSTIRRNPPGVEHMSENIELKGYLGETILRGSSLYRRSLGSVLSGIRESIRQKRLFIEDTTVPPRVELLVPNGEIRLSLTYLFRIPPPGAGILPSPDSASQTPGLPLKVELTSNYKIDPDTGLIIEHRLVETRINGQLTAGDQVSRWMRRFLNMDESSTTGMARNEDGALKAISDALSWFRSM